MSIGSRSKVWTREGLKPINIINEGDLVLTHQLRFRPVLHTFKEYYGGNIIQIGKSKEHKYVLITPEHLVCSISHTHMLERWGSRSHHWRRAEELEIGTLVTCYHPTENKEEVSKITFIENKEYKDYVYDLLVKDDFIYVTEICTVQGRNI